MKTGVFCLFFSSHSRVRASANITCDGIVASTGAVCVPAAKFIYFETSVGAAVRGSGGRGDKTGKKKNRPEVPLFVSVPAPLSFSPEFPREI